MRATAIIVVGSLWVFLPCCTASQGESLVFFDEDGGAGNPRGLYNFDTTTGASTLRCAMGGNERFFGMDVRRSDQKVFAVDLWGRGLWTINVNTGEKALVGTMSAIDRPEGIAFHPISGELYVSSVVGDLYKVNPDTAETDLIGSAGQSLNGHSFTPDGTRLLAFHQAAGSCFEVDITTGLATRISDGIPSSHVPEDSAFTLDGALYLTSYSGFIFELDPISGLRRQSWSTGLGSRLLGLITAPIPEPTTGASLGALAVLAACGVSCRRARLLGKSLQQP
ncbi:MAG: hypothetical protein JW809_12525 [Pirellulales bacterium]|nr:hypothetical protein [Pirellulales bacterium]